MRRAKLSTDKFDGTLLYQLHLVGNLLMARPRYYVSRITAIRRVGGEHYFGSSVSERGRFVPRRLAPEHSLNFVRGLFEIAQGLESAHGPEVGRMIRSDIARILIPASCHPGADQHESLFQALRFGIGPARLGKYLSFCMYRVSLSVAGFRICDAFIDALKRLLGSTPVMGGSARRSPILSKAFSGTSYGGVWPEKNRVRPYRPLCLRRNP